jgi:acyl-CoA thioester hydrolase
MDPRIDDNLAMFPVSIEVPVQWGDQDAFGHVNNTIFLRWFESARIAYCRRVGLSAPRDGAGVGPILAAISCNYRRQVTFPDTVRIGSRIARIGRTSLVMEHAILGEESGALVADGSSTIVVFDYEAQTPTPVPVEIRRAIEALEGGPRGG